MRTVKTTSIANIVCRIDAKTQGSGVLYKYTSDYVLLFTCKHVICDSKEFSIHFMNNHHFVILYLAEEIEILIDEEDKENDVAIVKIPICRYEILKDIPFIVAMTDDNSDGKLLSGYPEILNRTEIKCINLDEGRINNSVFRTSINLDTYTSEGLENAKGFSGGGIFSNFDGNVYLEGIVKKYSNEFKFFQYTPIKEYNAFLEMKGYKPVPVGGRLLHNAINFTEESLKDLEGIRSVIGTDIILERENVIDKLSTKKSNCCVVTGEPGVGKSAIVKNYLMENDFPVFFFKATQVKGKLLESLDIITCLSMFEQRNVIVIIDAAEKVFDMMDEDSFIQAVNKLFISSNIKLIISVRSYSLEALKKVLLFDCNFSDFYIVPVEHLNDKEFEQIEEKYPEIKAISNRAKELIKNPFYLDVVIREKLIGNLADIRNEYQLKDLIWDKITENNTNRKKALIELAVQKLEKKREYVDIDISDTIESALISNQIIDEKETFYRFTHDKYEDIADKKMFDSWYFEKGLPALLLELQNKLSYGRAYKNWILDRLSNGEIESISNELEQLYQNASVSYIWKWNTLESIYKSSNFVEFLILNKDKMKDDSNFIRRIYEISITTSYIELKKGFEVSKSQRLYFQWYVKPSVRLVYLIDFFCNNTDLISDKNRYYIVKILEESTKLLPIFKDKLIGRIPNVINLICNLIEELREIRYHSNKQLIKGIKHSFISYGPYFIDKSKEILLKIIDEDNCSFDHDFIESILVLSDDLEESVVVSAEFVEAFYLEIVRIYKEKSVHVEDSSRFYHSDIKNVEIYNINESLRHIEPHSFKTQFYTMLKVDFKRTLDFIIEFVNEKCKSSYDNQKRSRYYRVGLVDFSFRDHSTKIFNNGNHYLGYRGSSNVPAFVVSVLMSLERILLEKTETEDISEVLEKLIAKSNNLMLIGVIMSIIVKDYKKYGLLFIDLLPNYYLRELEIQRYANENMNLRLSFPTRDHLAKADREEYDKLQHRKEQFDNVLINLEQMADYREYAFSVIDRLKSQLIQEDEQYVNKYNFLHKIDLRNFICTGNQEGYYVYEAKEIDQKDVKKNIEAVKAYSDLHSEYSKLSNMLLSDDISKIHKEEAEQLIRNYRAGKYSSLDTFMEDELKVGVSVFYIFNPELLTSEQYEKEIRSCIEKALEVVSHDVHSFGRLVICLTKVFMSLNDHYLKKYYDDILYFFYSYFIKSTIDTYGVREVGILLRSHYGSAKGLIKSLVKLLIKYLEFDQLSFEIQQRLSLGKVIKIDELRKAEKLHSDRIVKTIRSCKEPKLDILRGFCPDRMYIVYPIAVISNSLTWNLVSETLLELLKQIKQNKGEKWIDRAALNYEYAISEFIVFSVNNDMLPRKLIDFIYLNLTIFHKVVGEVVDTLSAYVQDGVLEADSGWAFMNEALLNLAEYEHKANLITSSRNGFISNIDNLHLGQLLENLLLSNSKWINQMKPKRIKIIEGHEKEYLDQIIKFIDSPVAFRVFAMNLATYPEQIDCFSIFDYYEPLLKVALNRDIYNENNLLWYWEIVIELVFKRYNDLNAVNRDRYYELLTAIGCNAPSSFALFLRQKIEY